MEKKNYRFRRMLVFGLAMIMGIVFGLGPNAFALDEATKAQVLALVMAEDWQGIADLAATNPELEAQIGDVLADIVKTMPEKAAEIAAGVANVMPEKAAEIAGKVAGAAPDRASEIAVAVAVKVPDAADAIINSVVANVPGADRDEIASSVYSAIAEDEDEDEGEDDDPPYGQ